LVVLRRFRGMRWHNLLSAAEAIGLVEIAGSARAGDYLWTPMISSPAESPRIFLQVHAAGARKGRRGIAMSYVRDFLGL